MVMAFFSIHSPQGINADITELMRNQNKSPDPCVAEGLMPAPILATIYMQKSQRAAISETKAKL